MNSLLDALNARGPYPALVSYSGDERTELSGRVFANWLIKNINFLRDELSMAPGDTLVIDMPAHWKRTVMVVSGVLIGAKVIIDPDSGSLEDDFVLATSSLASPLAQSAREVLAIEPVSLALSFPGELDPFTVDWVQAVRGLGDYLTAPLGACGADASPTFKDADSPVVPVSDIDGVDRDRAFGAWLQGKCVLAPVDSLSESQLANEGLIR